MEKVPKELIFFQGESCEGPLVDVYETDDAFVCEIDLPGVDISKVSIQVYGDQLTIEGTRDEPEAPTNFLCMERGMRCFRRVVKMPVRVNASHAVAQYANGVVSIRFPKVKRDFVKIEIVRKS